jgi:hypothetical protein
VCHRCISRAAAFAMTAGTCDGTETTADRRVRSWVGSPRDAVIDFNVEGHGRHARGTPSSDAQSGAPGTRALVRRIGFSASPAHCGTADRGTICEGLHHRDSDLSAC